MAGTVPQALERATSLTEALLCLLNNQTLTIGTIRLYAPPLFQRFKHDLKAASASEEVIDVLLQSHIKDIQEITELSTLRNFLKHMLLQQSINTHRRIEAQLNREKTTDSLPHTSDELIAHSQAIRTLCTPIDDEKLHIARLCEMGFINDRARGFFLSMPPQSYRSPLSQKEKIDSDFVYCLRYAINCTDETLQEISFIGPVILSMIEMAYEEKINTKTYLDVLLENTQLSEALLSFFIKFRASNPQNIAGMFQDSAALRHCFTFFSLSPSAPASASALAPTPGFLLFLRRLLAGLFNGLVVLPISLVVISLSFLAYHLVLKPLWVTLVVPFLFGGYNLIRWRRGQSFVKAPIGILQWLLNALWLSAAVTLPLAFLGIGAFAGGWLATVAAPWFIHTAFPALFSIFQPASIWLAQLTVFQNPFIYLAMLVGGLFTFVVGWPTREEDAKEGLTNTKIQAYRSESFGTGLIKDIGYFIQKLFTSFFYAATTRDAETFDLPHEVDQKSVFSRGDMWFDTENTPCIASNATEWYRATTRLFTHEGIGLPPFKTRPEPDAGPAANNGVIAPPMPSPCR